MKKIFLIMFCMVLLVGVVSAVETSTWDNVLNYKNNDLTVDIINILGFSKLGTIELKSHSSVDEVLRFGFGKEEVTMYYDFTDWELYEDGLGIVTFTDMKTGKEIQKDYEFVEWKEVNVEVNDYKETCSLSLNGTNECYQEIIGTHIEKRFDWITLATKDIENKRIGIKNYVAEGDYIDAVWTIAGKEIKRHGEWIASLGVGNVVRLHFDETSGFLAENNVNAGGYGYLWNMNTSAWTTEGKFDGGLQTYNTYSTVNLSNITNIDFAGDITVCAWYKIIAMGNFHGIYNDWTGNYFWGSNDDGTKLRFYNGGPEAPEILTSMAVDDDTWRHVCFRRDTVAENNSIWVNGVLDNSAVGTEDGTAGGVHNIGPSSPSGEFFNGILDEFIVFNRSLTADEIRAVYNFIPIFGPKVTLNSPVDNLETTELTITFNGSVVSLTADAVTNISLIINDTYIETNTSGVNNTDYIFTKTLIKGVYIWTYESCDDSGSCTNATTRTLNILDIVENSRTFSNLTLEGTTETFIINYSLADDLQTSLVNLVYNGTPYSSIVTSSEGIVVAENNLIIPDVSANLNVSFHWNITLTNGDVISTSSSTQFINSLSIDDCSTNTNLVYNYTLYNEETQIKLQNTSIEIQIEVFDTSRSTNFLNFSKEYNDTTNPAKVCLNIDLLNTTFYSLDSTVKYNSNDSGISYATEYYNILNFTLENSSIPQHIALYDLLFADSTDFQLTFKDSSLAFFPDILVHVDRQYISDGDFKTVELPITDSNGQTILHLVRNDVVYNFIMVNSRGEIVATFNKIIAFCQDFTIESCSIRLNELSIEEQLYDNLEDVGISYSISYSNLTNTLSLDFVSLDLTTKTVKLEVLRNSGFGNRTVCEESLTASSGVIECDLSSISSTDEFLFINIYVSGSIKATETIDLGKDSKSFGISGYFIAFLFILFIITIFMDDKQVLIVALGFGWGIIISLGLIKGTLFGSISAGIWLVVSIIIFLWKLKKEKI